MKTPLGFLHPVPVPKCPWMTVFTSMSNPLSPSLLWKPFITITINIFVYVIYVYIFIPTFICKKVQKRICHLVSNVNYHLHCILLRGTYTTSTVYLSSHSSTNSRSPWRTKGENRHPRVLLETKIGLEQLNHTLQFSIICPSHSYVGYRILTHFASIFKAWGIVHLLILTDTIIQDLSISISSDAISLDFFEKEWIQLK